CGAGGLCKDWCAGVESEVASEVFARAERDADERDPMLDRDARDRRERAVAAGHSENVCLRRAGDGTRVVAVNEDTTVDASLFRGSDQLVLGAVAGARVDDQVAPSRRGL